MVTVKADNRRRVQLPDAKPGQVFAYTADGGVLKLVLVKPVEAPPMKGRLEKRGKRLVGVTDRPINELAIKELLAEFP